MAAEMKRSARPGGLIAVCVALVGCLAVTSQAQVNPKKASGLRQLIITPAHAVIAELDFAAGEQGGKKAKKKKFPKLQSSKAVKGKELTAIAAEPLYLQGCAAIQQGAELRIEIVDASAPLKKGAPGYFQLKLTHVTFADGRLREWDGGVVCAVGVDKSDKGKKMGMLPRKGGPVFLEHGQRLEFLLIPGSEKIPPECGGAEEEGSEGEEAGGEKPKGLPITLPASACG